MANYHGQIQLALAGFYDVLTDDGELFRTRARGNFRKRDMKPLVGDWVTFSADSQSEGYILDIDERDNSLVRPPVANVDQAIVVTAVKMPDWSSNLLDRQLVALEEKILNRLFISRRQTCLMSKKWLKMVTVADGYHSWISSYFARKGL